MKLITVASHRIRHMAAFEESCERVHAEPVILGMGTVFTGLTRKLKLVFQYVRTLPATETVVFADAHDSVITQPLAVVEARFRECGRPWLMSAERNCYPDPEQAHLYPECLTPYRYVNTGGWVGEAGYVLRVLERMQVQRLPDALNDQGVVADWLLSRPQDIALDHECQIFQTLHLAADDLEFDGDGIRNMVTGARPCIIHGNGGADLTRVLAHYSLPVV